MSTYGNIRAIICIALHGSVFSLHCRIFLLTRSKPVTKTLSSKLLINIGKNTGTEPENHNSGNHVITLFWSVGVRQVS